MKVKMMPISEISPDPANVRKHSDRNRIAIMDSLRRFGQQTPIVVDQAGVVRKGNGTLEAAIALGWEKIAVVVTTLTGADATAYAIVDNRSGDAEVGSTWDMEALPEVLDALTSADGGYSLGEMGFDDPLPGMGETNEIVSPETMPPKTDKRPDESNMNQLDQHKGAWILFHFGEVQSALPKAVHGAFLRQFEDMIAEGATEREAVIAILTSGVGDAADQGPDDEQQANSGGD